MSMGYGANHYKTITELNLEKLLPTEVRAFRGSIEGLKYLGDSEVYHAFMYGESLGEAGDNENLEYLEAFKYYTSLLDAFKNHTGLELGVSYHDSSENGSCYDDVDGCFWYVDGVLVDSKETVAFKAKYGNCMIDDSFFTTFG